MGRFFIVSPTTIIASKKPSTSEAVKKPIKIKKNPFQTILFNAIDDSQGIQESYCLREDMTRKLGKV
jgi:hypothetical protein